MSSLVHAFVCCCHVFCCHDVLVIHSAIMFATLKAPTSIYIYIYIFCQPCCVDFLNLHSAAYTYRRNPELLTSLIFWVLMFPGFGDLGLDLDKTGRIKLFSGTFIRASPLFLADPPVKPRAARQTAGLELVGLQGFVMVPLAGYSRGSRRNNVAVMSCYSNLAEAIGNKFCRLVLVELCCSQQP